ncbi:hypothetical protein INR49_000501, partial [Caranx melampygus]
RPQQLTEFGQISSSQRPPVAPLGQLRGPAPLPTTEVTPPTNRQVTARSGIFISPVVVFHPFTPLDSRHPELPQPRSPLCPRIWFGTFSASRTRRLTGILSPRPRTDADVLELGLHGPGGAAVATSELDPRTVSDLSATFASLAPLSIRPLSSAPVCNVRRPVPTSMDWS